jgi:protein TonB
MPAANPTSSNEPAAPKSAAIQPAKQDATAAHPANPALVAASLPATSAAKAPSSELLEVPEDFADDQIVHRVHATYPKQARARKLHGTVVLEAIVNKKGAVDSLQLVSGDPLLAQAAADAVKQWRYKPYLHNNEPTEFQTRITIDFKTP